MPILVSSVLESSSLGLIGQNVCLALGAFAQVDAPKADTHFVL